jgi:hypothetical protein
MYYALTRDDPESPYQVYGKGDDAAEAEAEAARLIRDRAADRDRLAENLITASREEAEQLGYVEPGAPVIWYDHLGHYRVEDHGPFHPPALQRRLQNRLT